LCVAVAFAAVCAACDNSGSKENGEGREAVDDDGCGRLLELLSSERADTRDIPTKPSIDAHKMSQEMGITWFLLAALLRVTARIIAATIVMKPKVKATPTLIFSTSVI
jgi:hypothetical protein